MVSESSIERKVFGVFGLNPEASTECFEVLSKEAHPQIKKWEYFFANLISASSRWIVMASI